MPGMQVFVVSVALLTLLNSHFATWAALVPKATINAVSLNIVNANLAPDGFRRSQYLTCALIDMTNDLFYRHCGREWTVRLSQVFNRKVIADVTKDIPAP